MPVTTHRTRPFSASQHLPDTDRPLANHDPEEAGEQLAEFIRRHPRLLILTGAGVSTDSGIPDYRDCDGAWKRKQPGYPARSAGWRKFRPRCVSVFS